MEIRKVLRKATAVVASASFIGATMLGAVAQDLSTYPSPFVKDGMFDALIVVGADAQAQDVVGAVDIGASLQFSLKKAATTGGTAEATIDTGLIVQKSGNKLNYGDNVSSVMDSTSLGEEDLPTIFADGKLVESEGDNKNSEKYTQELWFNNKDTSILKYAQDDDDAPKANDYLFIDKNKELYNYTLEFDSNVDYTNTSDTTANDDLKTATIALQGKVYTITNVQLVSSGGKLDKMTLLSGEAVLWLTQNNPIKKTVSGVEHTVEVLDVTENADACQVKVDDVVALVDLDETKTINGVQLGITDVRAINAQLQDVDVCQVSIGASEITIENAKKVKIDDIELDGSKGWLTSNAVGTWEGIEITLSPKDLSDNLYLSAGKAFTDPIFNSWKIIFGGISADYEEYSVKVSGDNDAVVKFINNDGKTVEIPIYYNESNLAGGKSYTVFLGDGNDIDERIYAAGNKTLQVAANPGLVRISNCTGTSSVEDCEGMRILATTTGGEAHLFEITDIDTTDNTTDIRDITYNKDYDDVLYTDRKRAAVTNSTLDLGSFGNTIVLDINETAKHVGVVKSIAATIETKAGGSIIIDNSQGVNNLSINFREINRAGGTDITDEVAATNTVNVTLDPNSDAELQLYVGGTYLYSSVAAEDGADDHVYVTSAGTKVTSDTENKDSFIVQMPKAEVYGNVFVAPIVAQVSTAASGVSSYTLTKLSVGAAKLDSEISDAGASNLIVVGGPCANKVAASVMGVTCANHGIAQGTAIIKAIKQASGKTALVVAGYDAIDTRRATRVLANYDQYALTGSEVVVTGTSLTDIQVKKSA